MSDAPIGEAWAREMWSALHDRGEGRGKRFESMRGQLLAALRADPLLYDVADRPASWERLVSQVVADPAMSAYVADPNAVQFVRLFADGLYEAAQAHRCGVLLIAHSTKAARRAKDADTGVCVQLANPGRISLHSRNRDSAVHGNPPLSSGFRNLPAGAGNRAELPHALDLSGGTARRLCSPAQQLFLGK